MTNDGIVFFYPARVPSLSDAELDALVAEAVVDCYDEQEQLSGLFVDQPRGDTAAAQLGQGQRLGAVPAEPGRDGTA